MMPTKKKIQEEKIVEEPRFGLREFSVHYKAVNSVSGADREFEGWLIEQLNDRFPVVTCDMEMATRIREIKFER